MNNALPFNLCLITVRESCGTYLARLAGQTASCTMGRQEAAMAVLRKHDHECLYEVELRSDSPSITLYSIVLKGGKIGRRET
jgi:hypothetical protein